jgi:hypothetical protein
MSHVKRLAAADTGKSSKNGKRWIGRRRRNLQYAQLSILQKNAIGKGPAGINSNAQIAWLSYIEFTAGSSSLRLFCLNFKA